MVRLDKRRKDRGYTHTLVLSALLFCPHRRSLCMPTDADTVGARWGERELHFCFLVSSLLIYISVCVCVCVCFMSCCPTLLALIPPEESSESECPLLPCCELLLMGVPGREGGREGHSMNWEPETRNVCVRVCVCVCGRGGGQAILSLLLEWTGWHCNMDVSDEEEEAFLLLFLGFSATTTRMLMMCTWKYMDLETTGNSLTVLPRLPRFFFRLN